MSKQYAEKKFIEYFKDFIRFKYDYEEMPPGLVIAISHKGKLVLNEAYGYSDIESKTKMRTDTLFRIASHSKTFTATAIMQLSESNKLNLDDRVVDYLPWLCKHKDQKVKNITIRQLLSHSSGITRDGAEGDYWSLADSFPSGQKLKAEILKNGLVIENNTKFKYSNVGYSLLGMVIEALTRKKYHDYINETIIEPLGLASTGPDYDSRLKNKLATGYTRREFNKKYYPIKHVKTNAMASATGFYSTAKDVCKFYDELVSNKSKLVTNESRKEMVRTQWRADDIKFDRVEYGLGFEIDYVNDEKIIGHGGGFPGFITKTIADPKNEIVISVLTNTHSYIASLCAFKAYKTLNYFLRNVKNPDKYKKYEGRYMDIWGTSEVLSLGDSLAIGDGMSWEPFINPTKLKPVNGTGKFKIVQTGNFGSFGEEVEFSYEKGKVQYLNFAGKKEYPETVYQTKLAQSDKYMG